eukprot:472492-Hanusia_phi.AAC.2
MESAAADLSITVLRFVELPTRVKSSISFDNSLPLDNSLSYWIFWYTTFTSDYGSNSSSQVAEGQLTLLRNIPQLVALFCWPI